jgi:serine/threonine protein kinase
MSSEVQPRNAVDTILQPGTIVDDKYRVDRLVGRGGMAAVWAGTNERTGKSVALKVILKSFSTTPEAEDLFRREALAASKVNHPNVVTVFDVINHEGMTCIVMELLDGEPLSNYLARKGFLTVEEAIALLLPAMRGVAAANAMGVVHRDLKPQNIFICIGPDGRHVTTKVLDFGISVNVERVLEGDSANVPGLMLGTPAYMSPEHVEGARNIDERADVYGFGVLLYEALTGHLPFMGEPGPSLLLRILNELPPPMTLYRADLPSSLVRIVEAAMAKKPDHRFSDVNSLVHALEEEFMPPSPLPRSLTPFAGVPLLPMRDGQSGSRSGAVAVSQPKVGSSPHGSNETRMLFAIPQDKEKANQLSDITFPSEATIRDPSTSAIDLRVPFLNSISRKLGQKGMIGVGVGLGVAFVIWLAIPTQTSESSRVVTDEIPQMPTVNATATPLRKGTAPTTESIGTAVSPAIKPIAPNATSSSLLGKGEPDGAERSALESGEAGRRTRQTKELAAARRSEDGTTTRSRENSGNYRSGSNKTSQPRAGKLTSDDF